MDKRVLQISMDIVVDSNIDGLELSNEILDIILNKAYPVVGIDYTGDMTEHYMKDSGFVEHWS